MSLFAAEFEELKIGICDKGLNNPWHKSLFMSVAVFLPATLVKQRKGPKSLYSYYVSVLHKVYYFLQKSFWKYCGKTKNKAWN